MGSPSSGKNTACFALVRLLPFVVIDTLSLHEEPLDGVRLFRNHGHEPKRKGIGCAPYSTAHSPGNSKPHTLAITKTRAGDERNVRLGPNGSVGCGGGLVEVFVRVVPAGVDRGSIAWSGLVAVMATT